MVRRERLEMEGIIGAGESRPAVVKFKRALIALLLFASGCSLSDSQPSGNLADVPVVRKSDTRREQAAVLHAEVIKIEPFFQRMGKPGPSDWLATHNEPGQTFDEYLGSEPVIPSKQRQKLYIVALGKLSATETSIVDTTASYLSEFYDLPVDRLPPKALDTAYPNVRQNRLTRTRQIRTGYILDKILAPMLPGDAAALIAFTAEDMSPNESMNYVFGQASLENRVGVWSLARLDDNADHRKFLSRTLKIATHETGHMFSIRHCTKYECIMSGTNHLGETDRRPIDACPECTAKICWLSDVKMAERYRRLANFCKRNKLDKEAEAFRRKADAVVQSRELAGR
jgi:archaemetzincin